MLKQLDATNKMMEDRNLFQFAFNNARILEKNNTFYIESFEERNGRICGSGTAYYPNQITITGNFQNDYPCGRCTLTFGASQITEETTFVNAHRTGHIKVTYPSGIVATVRLNDSSPFLFQSVIPYSRNFYNHSVIGFPCVTPDIIALSYNDVSYKPNEVEDVAWLLKHFDVHQISMNVDYSDNALRNIEQHCRAMLEGEMILSNPKFNHVQSVTLCCQALIAKNRLNYMLPEISSLRNINTLLARTVQRCCSCELEEEEKMNCNYTLNGVLRVLGYSPCLRSITIVAYPDSTLNLSGGLFPRVSSLTLKGGCDGTC